MAGFAGAAAAGFAGSIGAGAASFTGLIGAGSTGFAAGTGSTAFATVAGSTAFAAVAGRAAAVEGVAATPATSAGVISVQIRDTEVSGNVFDGIVSSTAAGQATVSITADRSSFLLNGGNGVLAQGGPSFVILARSTVISNTVGIAPIAGSHILSYQNNQLTGNANEGTPTGVLSVK